MPQLDPTWFASQLFWLTIIFGLFYVLLARFQLPRIQEALENRHNRIQHDLDRAASLQEEAEAIKESYEAALVRARDDARKLLAGVTSQIQENVDKQNVALELLLNEKVQESEHAIALAQANVQTQLTPVVTEITQDIVVKLLGTAPDAKTLQAAVEASLANQSKQAA